MFYHIEVVFASDNATVVLIERYALTNVVLTYIVGNIIEQSYYKHHTTFLQRLY